MNAAQPGQFTATGHQAEAPQGTMRILPRSDLERDGQRLLDSEFLVANGLGGYSSTTLAGALTRRYHGLLIAALPAPLGRMVMLSHVQDALSLPDGRTVGLGAAAPDPATGMHALGGLHEFRLENGLPVWIYRFYGVAVEKRITMPHRQNIVHVGYRLLPDSAPATLHLHPAINARAIESPLGGSARPSYRLAIDGERFEVNGVPGLPPLRLRLMGGGPPRFTLSPSPWREIHLGEEARRGYDSRGPLWCFGGFDQPLVPGHTVTLVAGTEEWRIIDALAPADVQTWEQERRRHLLAIAPEAAATGIAAELVLAADSFLMTPLGRVADVIHAYATGDEVRSVIAGYHWFTDWGRDTMIALEGLTLCTGRHMEAGWILRTFAKHVRDGLLPNMFPEGRTEGVYHTADATLWFFHAIRRYLDATEDEDTLRVLLPRLKDIVAHHRRGTRFGIQADPADGLLRQGEAGYQLTWMDAKVGEWVVTPRRGKAVEINALWYNALRLLEGWIADQEGEQAAVPVQLLADQVRESFNARFWNPATGHLFDVVDGEQGDDPACRPNQLFAISLDHPVLDRARWDAVVGMVRDRLLTPVGLRSLAPGHPDYKGRYSGDLHARDAAYHQGTVWGWLIGAHVDAWLKLHPGDKAGARALLEGFVPHLSDAGIGTVAEIFDADPPFTPRGCIAQAWSVAELLRCWLRTA